MAIGGSLFGDLADAFAEDMDPINPVEWAKKKLGVDLWSKQREICESIRDFGKTVVKSCHGAGKSYLAAVIVAWWIDTHPFDDTFVITTAPSANQVATVLWGNIRRIARIGGMPGDVHMNNQWVINKNIIGQGRKPADYNENSFQGIHAKYVLFILDEACGIPKWIWTAAITNTSSEHCRVLAIGNPDDPSSEFAKKFHTDSGWNQITISLWETPNFSNEEVSESAREHLVDHSYLKDAEEDFGRGSPMWQSKVEAKFPDNDDFGVIPFWWLQAAYDRYDLAMDIPPPTDEWDIARPSRRVIGVDVARMGLDKTVIAIRDGDVITSVEPFSKKDSFETATLVMTRANKRLDTIVVDMGGSVGGGVYDILKKAGYKVKEFHPGAKTKLLDSTKQYGFTRIRSAAWWKMREKLDPNRGGMAAFQKNDKLEGDLSAPRFEIVLDGKFQVEDKDDIKERLGRSTDYGDAVVMAFWFDPVQGWQPDDDYGVSWGQEFDDIDGAYSWNDNEDWRDELNGIL